MKLLQMFWIGVVRLPKDRKRDGRSGRMIAWNFPSPDGKVYGKLIINNFFLGYRLIDAPKPKENIMDEVMKKQSKFFDKINEQIDPDANEPWRQCDENH